MNSDNKRLTQLIRDLISKSPLSQADFARLAKMSPQQLNDTLSKGTSPRVDTLERIAKALGVPPFYLLMSAQERAQWDEIGKPVQSDLSAIERRLAALEAVAKPSEPKEEPCHTHLIEDPLIEGERMIQELERLVNDRPLEKPLRKKGNG